MGKGLTRALQEKAKGGGVARAGTLTGLEQHEMKAYQNDSRAVLLPVSAIVVKRQVRKYFDPKIIEERAEDIRVNGLLQPIVVCIEDGQFVLKMGEMRLRACRDILGWQEISAVLREKAGTLEQLAENIQRTDLLPFEIAEALRAAKEEHGITSDSELARIVHKSQSYVSRYLGLLSATADVREAIESGALAAATYFNNTALYKDGVPDWARHGATPAEEEGASKAVPAPKAEHTKPHTKGKKAAAQKLVMPVHLTEHTARAVFGILQLQAKHLKLKPLVSIGDLTPRQMQALINERAAEIYRMMSKKK